MTPEPDPYAVLGVGRDATQDEINSAYRRLVRQHHPDSHPDDPSTAESRAALERILAAYTVLRDPDRRAEHDRKHAPPPPRGQPVRDPRTKLTIRVSPVRYHGPNTQ